MISPNIILALALVAILNLQMAFARLGNPHVHGPGLPIIDRLQKVRKAHHTRRHLADDEMVTEIDKQLEIIDNLNYKAKEFMNQIEMAITWQTDDGA